MHERLKLFRTTLKLTQKDFAEKIEIDQRNYTNYENGKAELKAKHIQKLIENFKINANWLLTGEGEMLSENNIYIGDELRESFQDALIVLTEAELAQSIREVTVEKILEKLTMPRGILAKAFSFLTYRRPLAFLKLIMSHIKPHTESNTTYKQHLAHAIESLNLQTIQNIAGPAFTPSSKKYMLGRIAELSEEECKVIVVNSKQMLEVIESKMPLFIKIV